MEPRPEDSAPALIRNPLANARVNAHPDASAMRLLAALLLVTVAACNSPDAPRASDPDKLAEPGATGTVASPTVPDVPDQERAVEAAEDGELTVVFFGDSLTAGYGLADPEEEAYPGLIADRLAEAGLDANVINAGSSGETTAGGLRRVDWILNRTTPDVFVLALGANDMLRGQPPETTRANLTAIFAKVREAAPDARLVLAGMEALPNYGEAYGRDYRAVFREVAEASGAALIPFLLDGVGGVAELNQPDGVHPTPRGQRVMAETVWKTLGPIAGAAG